MGKLYIENFEVSDGSGNLIFHFRIEASSKKLEIFVNELSPEGKILLPNGYMAGVNFLRYERRIPNAPKRSS